MIYRAVIRSSFSRGCTAGNTVEFRHVFGWNLSNDLPDNVLIRGWRGWVLDVSNSFSFQI